MKSRTLFGLLCLASFIPFSPVQFSRPLLGIENAQLDIPSPWNKAKDAIDRMFKEPWSGAAEEFYNSISQVKGIKNDKTELLDYIFGSNPMMLTSSHRYGSIAMAMLWGDIYAARSTILLLGFIDSRWQKPPSVTSAARELILGSLGALIRLNPALFLRACFLEREGPYLKDKGFPAGFVPDFMNEPKTRALYELEMMKKALRSAKAPELRLVRDECVRILEREIKENRSGISGREKEKHAISQSERIKDIIVQMENRPSSENMRRVLALFSEIPTYNWRDIFPASSSPPSTRSPSEIALDLVLREAVRGNEGAVEVLLRTLNHFGGLESMRVHSAISQLILTKPALFIKKLAKYGSALDIKGICNYWGSFEHPGFNRDAILRRRLETLTALRMPKYDKLILRCIGYIQNELAARERSFGDYQPHNESLPRDFADEGKPASNEDPYAVGEEG